MLRLGWAPAGIAGWVLRLVFAASVVLGGYGAYTSLILQLPARDPVHEQLHGLAIMGIALGVSAVALTLLALCVDGPAGNTRGDWYVALYGLFAVTLLATFMTSIPLRLIGDWQRSNVSVTATVANCAEPSGNNNYYCDYDWTWAGVKHRQNRVAGDDYADGTAVGIWIDPVTGGADDHSIGDIGGGVILALLACGGAVWAWTAAIGTLVRERRKRARGWLDSLTWWVAGPRPR